jgi:hypothetical protein
MLYVVIALLFVRVIYPIDDEAFFANPAYNLVMHGTFGTNIVEHNKTLPGIETRTYWFQPLYSLLLSGWFQVLSISLLSQRLLSMAWGLVALAAWFLVTVRLTRNVWCAGTVALALALDYVFLCAAGTGRMDMMSAALSWLGVALYLEFRHRSLPLAVFLGGSACALNVVTHPLGAILGALNLIVVIGLLDLSRIRLHLLLCAAAPFAVIGGVWAAYILQSPGDFVAQFSSNVIKPGPAGHGHRLSGFANPLHALAAMVSNVVQGLYGPVHPIAGTLSAKVFIPIAYLVVVAIAVAYRLIRREVEIRVLLLLCLVDFVTLALVNVGGKVNYFVHVLPLFTVLAVLVAWRSSRLSRGPRFAVFVSCAILLVLNEARLVHSIHQDAYRSSYLPVQLVLRKVIPSTATVFAQAEWAYALGFERILHDGTLGFLSGKRLDYAVVDHKEQEELAFYSRVFPGFTQYAETLLTKEYALVYQDSLVRIYQFTRKQ